MKTFTIVASLVIASVLLASSAVGQGTESIDPDRIPEISSPAIYLDTTYPFNKRADDLVARMSLREKVGQMLSNAPAIDRLGVPAYTWWNECLHGVMAGPYSTVFPQAIGMAATWDTDLIHQVADAISTEARAKTNDSLLHGRGYNPGLDYWSPNINIVRDPRWGRGQETYGEDPFLTGRLAVAFVTGLQGNNPKYLKVVSTPKHFAVHSGPEPKRGRFDATPPERDMYETYLPQFEAAVREGKAYSVMGAYSAIDGAPCCADPLLMEDILRKAWGFRGYIVTDCGAINCMVAGHKTAKSLEEASARAVKTGTDLCCGDEYLSLVNAVQQGLVTEQEIDVCVKRLMLARMRLGTFDPVEKVPYARIPIELNDCAEHKALALKTARESIVLLKNDGILPFGNGIRKIAVIGPNADNVATLYGNYNGTASDPITILAGIQAGAGAERTVTYFQGCDYIEMGSYVPIPESALRSDGRPGLMGEYFANTNFEGKPALTRQDSNVDFDWKRDSPAPGIPRDNFSVRWSGELIPPADKDYAFTVRGDDGYRLKIDGKTVIEDWTDHAYSGKSCKIALKAGKPVKIVLEYYEHSLESAVSLLWVPDPVDAIREIQDATDAADAVVFVGGIRAGLEGEEMALDVDGFLGGDRTRIELPKVQTEMLKLLHSTGKPVVFVNCSGSAIAMPWEAENLPAIVQAWYPGQAGGTAVADVLFGRYNPAGRLPVTFYASTTDLPDFEDYSMANRTYRYFRGKALWPFGYGLSYTKFDYKDMKLSKLTAGTSDTVMVTCDVTNTGDVDGDEVVQLYVRDSNSPSPRPIKSLRGFARVHIKKGATERVTIPLSTADLRYWDTDKKSYVVYPGRYELMVGASSVDIRLRGKLDVK